MQLGRCPFIEPSAFSPIRWDTTTSMAKRPSAKPPHPFFFGIAKSRTSSRCQFKGGGHHFEILNDDFLEHDPCRKLVSDPLYSTFYNKGNRAAVGFILLFNEVFVLVRFSLFRNVLLETSRRQNGNLRESFYLIDHVDRQIIGKKLPSKLQVLRIFFIIIGILAMT